MVKSLKCKAICKDTALWANYHPLLFAILKAGRSNMMRSACSKVFLLILITGRG